MDCQDVGYCNHDNNTELQSSSVICIAKVGSGESVRSLQA